MKVHCLFEQSGTFKNAFKKLGIVAYDYDINNNFNQTDFQIDIFQEMESIINKIKKEDLIIAFFPCTFFSDMNELLFTCNHKKLQNMETIKKIVYTKSRHRWRNEYYSWLCNLIILCLEKGIKLIIENPKSKFLQNTLPIKPTIIEEDRRTRGDWYQKPTFYYFINFKPKNNYTYDYSFMTKKVVNESGIDRSLMSPQYAENFIKDHIL